MSDDAFPSPTDPLARPSTGIASLPPEVFLANITGCQSSLFAYICNLLGDVESARDVLQETNLALWQKVHEYDSSLPFRPWAIRFAHNQVLSFRSRQQRDRLVFDETVLAQISDEALQVVERFDERMEALEYCVGKLPKRQRDLVRRRYADSRRLQEIADHTGRKISAISVTLFRIRQAILDCVMNRMKGEARP